MVMGDVIELQIKTKSVLQTYLVVSAIVDIFKFRVNLKKNEI